MRHRDAGFTLVEMMIVVGIIAILVAVALPAYQDYSMRAKMADMVLALSSCRNAITEVYQSASTPPAANSWGCERAPVSKYVQKIETDANGVVRGYVTGIGAAVDGAVVTMIPLRAAGAPATMPGDKGSPLFGWLCGGTGTTIDLKYLPSSCRGS